MYFFFLTYNISCSMTSSVLYFLGNIYDEIQRGCFQPCCLCTYDWHAPAHTRSTVCFLWDECTHTHTCSTAGACTHNSKHTHSPTNKRALTIGPACSLLRGCLLGAGLIHMWPMSHWALLLSLCWLIKSQACCMWVKDPDNPLPSTHLCSKYGDTEAHLIFFLSICSWIAAADNNRCTFESARPRRWVAVCKKGRVTELDKSKCCDLSVSIHWFRLRPTGALHSRYTLTDL